MLKPMIVSIGALLLSLIIPLAGRAVEKVEAKDYSVQSGRRWKPDAWKTEEWTGDDKPYRRARNSIDKTISKNPQFEKLLLIYEQLANKNSSDALAQFRWAYMCYKAAIQGSSKGDQKIAQAERNIAFVSSPKTYEYARLRFLILARNVPQRQLKGLGERLLLHNPSDYDVKYYMVKILNPGLSPKEKAQALSYCRDLVRLAPKKPSAYSALGGVYYRSWLTGKGEVDANNAIAAYRKYLKLAPPGQKFRPQAEGIIKMIQHWQDQRGQS